MQGSTWCEGRGCVLGIGEGAARWKSSYEFTPSFECACTVTTCSFPAQWLHMYLDACLMVFPVLVLQAQHISVYQYSHQYFCRGGREPLLPVHCNKRHDHLLLQCTGNNGSPPSAGKLVKPRFHSHLLQGTIVRLPSRRHSLPVALQGGQFAIL